MDQKMNYPTQKSQSVESILQSVFELPGWIYEVAHYVQPQINTVIENLDPCKVQYIYLTGCGDSYFAPVAARLAFEKHTGVRTEAIEALEFSRYSVDNIQSNSLVIGISNSGSTSRPLEAVRLSLPRGAQTIAITGNPASPMSQSANQTIIQAKKDWNETLAVSGYLASAITLYLFALALGRYTGQIDQNLFDRMVGDVFRSSEIIQATLATNNEPIKEFAFQVGHAPFFQILGGGPSYGTALFNAAKLFELPKAHGVPVQLEEWAHQQFFITRANTPLLVIAPPGNSIDRAREQIQGGRDVGATVAAICDVDDVKTKQVANVPFTVMGRLPEELSPITYMIPGALFALHLCNAQGKTKIENSQLHYEVNMRQLRQSKMRED